MKVMIVGSGGREHALAWKLSSSPLVDDIIFAPGNGGMSAMGECVGINVEDPGAIARLAAQREIELAVIGPEAPLVSGAVDALLNSGIKAFGPTRDAARLEGSKNFAKAIMERHGVPTGAAKLFEDFDAAKRYVEEQGAPIVVKADGLAAGKGVIIAQTVSEAVDALRDCLVDKAFGASGDRVLVEEFMEGPEVSMLSLTDGQAARHMVPSQDHKRVNDGDEGPNTGGMGAYSPVPLLGADAERAIQRHVMEATIAAMREEETPYTGVLYGGLMLTSDGPRTLEFNVRFGDPETQVVLPRMASDLAPALLATVNGTVSELELSWSDGYCVCVVLASGGYPGKYATGVPISGLKAASSDPGVEVFHAGTKVEDGRVVTSGGRVLNVVALGRDFEEARGLAYQSVEMIKFEGMHYRTDIGYRAIEWQREHGG